MKNKVYDECKVNNFRELLDYTATTFNNNVAFTIKDKEKKLYDKTFIDFKNDVKELGTALLDLNLKNNKIGLISPDRYEWCCSYFAIATTGNTIVPFDCLLPQIELEQLVKRSGIKAVIFDSKFLPMMDSLRKSPDNTIELFICMDLENSSNQILSYSRLLATGKVLIANGNITYDNIKIDNNALSVLIFTSGTTSTPKAVMLSQYNICSNVSAMTTLIKHKPNDTILIFLPLHHTLACTASFLFCHFIGFRLCFADSIKDIAKNMKEYKISGFVSVPALLDIMYRQIIKGVKKER